MGEAERTRGARKKMMRDIESGLRGRGRERERIEREREREREREMTKSGYISYPALLPLDWASSYAL